MGNGYAILVWDEWGSGLVRVNARLHSEGEDIYGNPNNWFSYEGEKPTSDELMEKHGLDQYDYFKVIW